MIRRLDLCVLFDPYLVYLIKIKKQFLIKQSEYLSSAYGIAP